MREFWEACENGDIGTVEKLVTHFSDIDQKNDRGWNAIIMAAFHHHKEIVQILLDHGADINSANGNGTTVFMYAKTKVLENGDYDFLDWLIQQGADINRKDKKKGWTVLDYAHELNSTELVTYLKRNGAL